MSGVLQPGSGIFQSQDTGTSAAGVPLVRTQPNASCALHEHCLCQSLADSIPQSLTITPGSRSQITLA